jgi:hypothetical protein
MSCSPRRGALPRAITSMASEKLVYLPGCQDEYQGKDLSPFPATASVVSPPNFELSLQWFVNRTNQREHLLASHYPPWHDRRLTTESDKQRILNSFWFICFNRLEKISPDVFDDWMLILARRPNAILVLMTESEEAKHQLQVPGSLCLSLSLSVSVSLSLSASLSFSPNCLSLSLYLSLSVSLSVCLPACLSLCLPLSHYSPICLAEKFLFPWHPSRSSALSSAYASLILSPHSRCVRSIS